MLVLLCPLIWLSSGLVFFVADLFQPINGLAIELFLDGDVGYGSGRGGAVPMFLTWRDPEHIAGVDLLDGTSPTLGEAAACCHDQCLAQWVGVPICSSAGFKRNDCAGNTRRLGSLKW